MKEQEMILSILKEIKPTSDFSATTDIIDGGYLDSIELMGLIALLSERFEVEIDFDWIAPELFNSVDAMANMIKAIKQ